MDKNIVPVDWDMENRLASIWAIVSRVKPTRILLNLSLVLALGASLGHVAFAFSSVNGGSLWAGYMSAIALDVGLISLAIGIKSRKAEGRSLAMLWLGVIGFTTISIYANWLSGISHLVDLEVSVSGIGVWLVWLRPILLSGVIPAMAVYLSEIVSGDHETDAKIAQKEERKRVKRLSSAPNDTSQENIVDHLDEANDTRQAQIKNRRERVNELAETGMSQAEIANELEVSLATIKRDARASNGKQ